MAAFALAQRAPFNPREVIWDPRQFLYLLLLYVLLAVPFLCAALPIGLSYYRYGERIGVLYRADLVGAGSGAGGVILMLFVLSPERALELLGALGFVAGGLITGLPDDDVASSSPEASSRCTTGSHTCSSLDPRQ